MNELEQIKARAAKATPGPWKLWGMQVMADPVGNSDVGDALPIANTTDPHRGLRTFNAYFIAHARDDVPRLVAALEAALSLVDHFNAATIQHQAGVTEKFGDTLRATIHTALEGAPE